MQWRIPWRWAINPVYWVKRYFRVRKMRTQQRETAQRFAIAMKHGITDNPDILPPMNPLLNYLVGSNVRFKKETEIQGKCITITLNPPGEPETTRWQAWKRRWGF